MARFSDSTYSSGGPLGGGYVRASQGNPLGPNWLVINNNETNEIDLHQSGTIVVSQGLSDDIVYDNNDHGVHHGIGGGIDNAVATGDGNDTVYANARSNNWYNGGNGHDTLVLTGGDNNFVDLSAQTYTNDWNNGVGNLIHNTSTVIGFEDVVGTDRSDTIIGDANNNQLYGNGGDDILRGGLGNDILTGGRGGDVLDGGAGIDTARYYDAADGVIVNLGNSGLNTGEAAGDTYISIENLVGSQFGDVLTGDAGNNYIDGAQGNDIIRGGAGNDTLFGNLGRDILTGGSGADVFKYTNVAESVVGAARDVILDFTHGQDHIDLSGIDANTNANAPGRQAFNFIGTQAFNGNTGQLHEVFVGANTIVEGDINGDGHADFQIELAGHITLTADDFGNGLTLIDRGASLLTQLTHFDLHHV